MSPVVEAVARAVRLRMATCEFSDEDLARAAIEALAANISDKMVSAAWATSRDTPQRVRENLTVGIRAALTAQPTRNEPDPSQ